MKILRRIGDPRLVEPPHAGGGSSARFANMKDGELMLALEASLMRAFSAHDSVVSVRATDQSSSVAMLELTDALMDATTISREVMLRNSVS